MVLARAIACLIFALGGSNLASAVSLISKSERGTGLDAALDPQDKMDTDLGCNDIESRWVDASGSFYSGSVIEITEESWCPLDVKEAVHTSATYSHKILSCRRAELFEQRTNGVQKKFRATVGPNQTLFVELPINNLQWTLVRDSARSISWPSGLRLSFDDAEDELRHTAEANQRNRLPTLATSALLMAAALGEARFEEGAPRRWIPSSWSRRWPSAWARGT
ncbi:unnamed protein product [Prorocentrum cordatum]|uniref:Uncharacterized protein n=1 Tax=Prorocentrum cordatum TaxID=2364126 RepID=A0ABN9T3A9_9DINO|nr:unnamed protein product [Polarella glacialis]